MEGVSLYFAYLDEFGHIGPFISRVDPSYNTSPVFGLGGIVLPYDKVRGFATWFFKLKCSLLAFEIARDGVHPSRWEKKGSALLTTQNVAKYRQLRLVIDRILTKIESIDGFVFYQGIVKHRAPSESSSQQLYSALLRLAIRKLDIQCVRDGAEFVLVLDECDPRFHRDVIIKKALLTMFGADYCSRLVEPPFQVASHLYQTLQCADWICGLIGRLGAYEADPIEFSDFAWAQAYFGDRLKRASKRSRIRSKKKALHLHAELTSSKVVASSTVTRITRLSADAVGAGAVDAETVRVP